MVKYDTQKLMKQKNIYAPASFDSEMIFVECGKCGSPIMWEAGRTTKILLGAGIDPLEVDSHCLLVTNGCPRCTKGDTFHVQIVRVQKNDGIFSGMHSGNA